MLDNGGPVCTCPDGEKLGNDGKTCETIPANPCDSARCADACIDVNGVATCACFDGTTLQDDGISCGAATSNPEPEPETGDNNSTSTENYPDNMHDNDDNYIHARNFLTDTHCWYKNFHGWKAGQKLVYVPCDRNSYKPKYQFEWSNSTGLIKLPGSVGKNGFADGLCVRGHALHVHSPD